MSDKEKIEDEGYLTMDNLYYSTSKQFHKDIFSYVSFRCVVRDEVQPCIVGVTGIVERMKI